MAHNREIVNPTRRCQLEALLAKSEALIGPGRIDDAKSLIDEAWKLTGAESPEAFIWVFTATGEKEKASRILARTYVHGESD